MLPATICSTNFGSRPLVFDHVQIAVGDLEATAARFLADHGLRSSAGGHHPGRGTANRIIPLGECYLELITIA
ncbi:MAG: VOC family protein, partial [Candidatus Dormibacteraeota bacterium]|nr:VOC family protein [Candidatus Dormibacteraeota bacterium]